MATIQNIRFRLLEVGQDEATDFPVALPAGRGARAPQQYRADRVAIAYAVEQFHYLLPRPYKFALEWGNLYYAVAKILEKA